jgi:hypothetical protein
VLSCSRSQELRGKCACLVVKALRQRLSYYNKISCESSHVVTTVGCKEYPQHFHYELNKTCCRHNLCPSISFCKVHLGLSCSFSASELLCIMAVSGDIIRCGYHPKLLLVSLPQLIEGAIEIFGNGRCKGAMN